MGTGLSMRLKYRTAARLQDAIRNLGKHKRGDEKMSELITEAEELGVDIIRGNKPMILGNRTSYLLMSLAAFKNSECRRVDYGLHESNMERIARFAESRQRHREKEDQRNG